METDFNFTADREKAEIRITKFFGADVNRVWDAFTKSEILDRWWAPEPWRAETQSMDFRPGGRWMYAMVGPEGEKHYGVAEYKSVDPYKSFTLTDAFVDEDGNVNTELPKAEWEVSFWPSDEGTKMQTVMRFDSVSDLDQILEMGFREGYEATLEQLNVMLRTR